MKDSSDDVQAWVEKAEEDLTMAELGVESENPPTSAMKKLRKRVV